MAFKFLGKLLVIAAIFIVGHHDIYAGIALVLSIILLDKNTSLIEGMENKGDDGVPRF